MMIKQILSIATAVMLLLALAACGKTSGDSSAAITADNASTADSANVSDETITGQVTVIDGSTITIDVGTLSATAGGPGNAQNGGDAATVPSGSSDGSNNMPAPPDNGGGNMPDGQAPGGGQGGGNPPAGGGGFPGFATTGETKTIIIESDTVITLQSQDNASATGTISDIAVGDIITVTMSDSKATAISVMSMGSIPNGAVPDGAVPGDPADDSAANASTDTTAA